MGPIEKKIAAKILNIFIPLGKSVPFSDIWSAIIPMDNAIKDTLIPTAFAELWFDVDKAAGMCFCGAPISYFCCLTVILSDAVKTLRDLNESDSGTIGNFFTEFYSAKVR